MSESDQDPTDDTAPEESPEPVEETPPAEGPSPETGAADPTVEQQLAERTLDLQRIQAEYVNYKRRVDRDRELVRGQGEIAVLQSLLTVLDDIGRAAEHGELSGGFKAVADSLQGAATKHRLEAFGAKGEAFDPSLHEAVFKVGESADVEVTTIEQVLRTGYRVGDRVLRAATVGVIEPGDEPAPEDSADTGTNTEQ